MKCLLVGAVAIGIANAHYTPPSYGAPPSAQSSDVYGAPPDTTDVYDGPPPPSSTDVYSALTDTDTDTAIYSLSPGYTIPSYSEGPAPATTNFYAAPPLCSSDVYGVSINETSHTYTAPGTSETSASYIKTLTVYPVALTSASKNSPVHTSPQYTTPVHTITHCDPEVTNCPAGPTIVTETEKPTGPGYTPPAGSPTYTPAYTPQAYTPGSSVPAYTPPAGSPTTTTATSCLTRTYIVSKCAPYAEGRTPGSTITTVYPIGPVQVSTLSSETVPAYNPPTASPLAKPALANSAPPAALLAALLSLPAPIPW